MDAALQLAKAAALPKPKLGPKSVVSTVSSWRRNRQMDGSALARSSPTSGEPTLVFAATIATLNCSDAQDLRSAGAAPGARRALERGFGHAACRCGNGAKYRCASSGPAAIPTIQFNRLPYATDPPPTRKPSLQDCRHFVQQDLRLEVQRIHHRNS